LQTGISEVGFGSFNFGKVRENADDGANRGKVGMIVIDCRMVTGIRWGKGDEA
jgi:hypothetical protein